MCVYVCWSGWRPVHLHRLPGHGAENRSVPPKNQIIRPADRFTPSVIPLRSTERVEAAAVPIRRSCLAICRRGQRCIPCLRQALFNVVGQMFKRLAASLSPYAKHPYSKQIFFSHMSMLQLPNIPYHPFPFSLMFTISQYPTYCCATLIG